MDKLKIDQSFVRDMLTGSDGASIVQAIIQLGHNLQLTVIAEGGNHGRARSERQDATRRRVGLFSRPVPVDRSSGFCALGSGGLAAPSSRCTICRVNRRSHQPDRQAAAPGCIAAGFTSRHVHGPAVAKRAQLASMFRRYCPA